MPKKVYLFEKNCCGPSPSTEFVAFLQRKFADEIKVKVFDLAQPNGLLPMPSSLLAQIKAEGAECLPALVVDGIVVAERKLPNFLEAVELIRTGQPSQTSLTPVLTTEEKKSKRCV
jgi:Arsenical resistance operon protein ArsD